MKRLRIATLAAILATASTGSALAAFGDPDPTYGTKGVAPILFGQDPTNPSYPVGAQMLSSGAVTVVAPSGNGTRSVLATVRFSSALARVALVRRNVGASDISLGTAVAIGGGFLTPGSVITAGGEELVVVKTTASGALDTTFGRNGVASVGPTDVAAAPIVARGLSGKILLAVGVNVAGKEGAAVRLMRLNANGSIDRTFGTRGTITIPAEGSEPAITALVVTGDGKIVLSLNDYFASGGGAIMRRKARGGIDTTYDGDGIAATPPGITDISNFFPTSLAAQGDRKVTVLATDYSSGSGGVPMAYRLTTAGTVDSTFGMAASRTNLAPPGSTNGRAAALIRRSGGRYAATGASYSGVSGPWLGRMDANGKSATSILVTAAGAGMQSLVLAANGSRVAMVGTGAGGKLAIVRIADSDATGAGATWALNVAGGITRTSMDYYGRLFLDRGQGVLAAPVFGDDVQIAALTAAGRPNTSFGSGTPVGSRTFPGLKTNGYSPVTRRLPDGRVAVGITNPGTQTRLVMLTSTGAFDSTFAGGGDLALGTGAAIGDVLPLPGGKLLLAMGRNTGGWHVQLVRLLANGTYDPTFSGDGIVEIPYPVGVFSSTLPPGAIHVHADATGYVAVGGSNQGAVVARVSSSGVPDPSIGSGTGLTTVGPTDLKVFAATVDNLGRTVVVGQDATRAIALRLTRQLVPDTTFSGDGVASYTVPNGYERLVGVSALPDRSLVVRGINIPTSGGHPTVTHALISASGLRKARRVVVGSSFEYTPVVLADGRVMTANYMYTASSIKAFVRRLKGLSPLRALSARRTTGRYFRAQVNARGLTRTAVIIQARRNGRWVAIGRKNVPAKLGYRVVKLRTARQVTDSLFRAVTVNASGRANGKPFRG